MHEVLRSLKNDFLELVSYNPATEEEIGRVKLHTKAELDSMIELANESFKKWSAIPLKLRIKYLKNLQELIYEQADEIATLIAQEQGKTKSDALLSEIASVLMILKKMPSHAREVLRERKASHEMILFTNKKSAYRYEPYGVIAVISPWNFPFSVPVPEIAAAMMTGNTVIFKPAPGTPLIGAKISELFEQAGFPQGTLNTAFLSDEDASYLTRHPGIQKIFFTGSVKTGEKVMCSAASQQIDVVLELGSKDSAIVAADADISRAARGIVWAAIYNSGQVCASVERVYVERAVADQFIDECLTIMKEIKVGDPMDETTDVGPLENPHQMFIVLDHIKDAKEKGAKILYGGRRIGKKGFFLEPTLLVNVNHEMKIMKEETFGPVLPVMVVDSIEEAIALANDNDFGLSAYGWTKSKKTARKLQEELKAGTVVINDATYSWAEPNAPWGGYKKSGIGRTRGIPGMYETVQLKYISYDKGNKETNFWWFPTNGELSRLAADSLHFLFARKWTTRIRSLMRLASMRRFSRNFHWLAAIRNIRKIF